MYYDINGNPSLNDLKRIRILEYNVGNFSHDATYGSSDGYSGYTGEDIDGYIAEWATFIGRQSADLSLITESRRNINSANTALSADRLYSPLFNSVLDNYVTSANNPYGRVLLSQAEQNQTLKKTFTNQKSSSSGYVGALMNINGIDVFVVSVHFIHGGEPNYSVRALQMAELVNDISQYENVIIGGDLNTHDLSYELDTLINAGFTFANGGVWGTHSTYLTDPNAPLDNVGVKGDKLKLVGFNVLTDVSLSDHYPTITEILVG